MVQVFTAPLYRRHYAPIFSEAFFLRAFMHIGIIALALVIAYTTGGFWAKLKPDYGQATCHYTGDALMLMEGLSPTQSLMWSTSDALNAEFSKNYVPASFQAAEIDLNFDGKPDIIEATMNVPTTVPIHSLRGLIQVRYRLREIIDVSMYGLIYVTYNSALPGGTFTVDGEVLFHQKNPKNSGYFDLYDSPILTSDRAIGNSTSQPNIDLAFENILKSYLDRNYTTIYSNQYPVWKSGNGGTFESTIRMRIPPAQFFFYRPEAIEILKYGWIQFLATYIVLLYIVTWVEWFVFRFRIVTTTVIPDLRPQMQRF